MSDALSKIKAKIFALSQKTVDRGCSENEAMMAMLKVSQLLSDYNLTMSEVELKDEKTTQKAFTWGEGVQYVSGSLLATIAEFCDCKVWYKGKTAFSGTITKTGKYRIKRILDGCNFYGFEQDIQMAEYLYSTLNAAIYNDIQRFKKTSAYLSSFPRKSASTSFEHGMNHRLCVRLRQLKSEMRGDANASTNKALVIVKNQMVEEGYKSLNLKLRTSSPITRTNDGNSYNAGRVAADKVNLSRPLNGGKDYLRIS